MTIDRPLPEQLPQLRGLWKEAFGDTDAFLDIFFHRAFSRNRCRCVTLNGQVVAALYWFDCGWNGKSWPISMQSPPQRIVRGRDYAVS